MGVYAVRAFRRWMKAEGLVDADLCRAAAEMARGLIDADLGGGLLKKRIARNGQGKRGGFRTLVANHPSNHWFFVYGYAKHDMANLSPRDERDCRRAARLFLSLDAGARDDHVAVGELSEMDCDA